LYNASLQSKEKFYNLIVGLKNIKKGKQIYEENDLKIVLNYCDGNYNNHPTHFMVSLGLQIMGNKQTLNIFRGNL